MTALLWLSKDAILVVLQKIQGVVRVRLVSIMSSQEAFCLQQVHQKEQRWWERRKNKKKPGGISVNANQQMPWSANQIQYCKYKSIHLMQSGTKKVHWHWATGTKEVSVPPLSSDWQFQLKRKQNLALCIFRSNSCFKLLSTVISNYCKVTVSPDKFSVGDEDSCMNHKQQ